jgi:hypothetical protein
LLITITVNNVVIGMKSEPVLLVGADDRLSHNSASSEDENSQG